MTAVPVVLIEGDGIGPEIMAAAIESLEATGIAFAWDIRLAGLRAYEELGVTAPSETLEAIREAGAALKGPFTVPAGGTYRSPNWYIRRDLDLFACVRRIESIDGEVDVCLVRENTEDLYAAIEWMASDDVAQAVKVTTRRGCERIARFAFELCRREGRKKVSIVHKANNLKYTEGMFLDVSSAQGAAFPEIKVDDVLADSAAARLVSEPQTFDVLLTTNTFGDLLANVGAARVGGMGILSSANIGEGRIVAEAGHGSAPEIAGQGRANPLGLIDAGAMLLEFLGYVREATAVHRASLAARAVGTVTPDLGGAATTKEVAADIARAIRDDLHSPEFVA